MIGWPSPPTNFHFRASSSRFLEWLDLLCSFHLQKKEKCFTNASKCITRIEVQGVLQVEGMDYHDTFSPTVGPIAVCTSIASVIYVVYHLYLTGIAMAFLSANTDNPHIYVQPLNRLEEQDRLL